MRGLRPEGALYSWQLMVTGLCIDLEEDYMAVQGMAQESEWVSRRVCYSIVPRIRSSDSE